MTDELQSSEQDKSEPRKMAGEPKQSRREGRIIRAFVVVAIVLGFGVAVLYAYNKGRQQAESKLPPIIQAQKGPMKVRPESPGGMRVPDQDKEVFTRLTAEKQTGRIERLLPPPEEPIEVPLPVAKNSIKVPETQKKLDTLLPVKTRQPRGVSTPESSRNISINNKSVQTAVENTQPVKPKTKYGEAVYRIQLSSMRSEVAIRKKWMSLKAKHKDLLGNLKLTVERAVLNRGQGVFYRLQASPLTSKEKAAALCAKIKVRKVGCFVVRR